MKAPAFFQKLMGSQPSRKLWIGMVSGVAVLAIAGGGVVYGVKQKKPHGEVAEAASHEHEKGGHESGHERAPAAAEHHSEHSSEHKAEHKAESKAVAHAADSHADEPKAPGLMARYQEAWNSVQEKVEALRKADQENERLRLENANLRLKLEARQFDCHADDAARATRDFEVKLDHETGSKMGRTLASISYKPPMHLLPQQLYALAVAYFKAREDEKAAVLLTFLTGLEEDDTFKTPKNLLMTGIAWYRLDNYVVAENYFDRVYEKAQGPEHQQVAGQVRLWKALTFERLGKHVKSQQWLREVLNFNPHSTEAAWVNHREVGRVPASAGAED